MSQPTLQDCIATIKDLIEAGDGIRCYPSGAVGFDEWYEAQEKAQALLKEFLDEEWRLASDGGERVAVTRGPTGAGWRGSEQH